MTSTSSPIVVTGLGVWSAAGTSPDALWERALSGRSPATWLRPPPDSIAACLAPDPPASDRLPQAHRMDRSTRLALAAADPAFRSARLEEIDPTRIAIVVGNSRGPAGLWSEPPTRRVRPTRAANTAVASPSGALSLAFRVRGPCLTVSATCASAAHALFLGTMLLRSGSVDAVLAGGAEAPLAPPLVDQFRAAGILGSASEPGLACRPFDRRRNGTIPGEGSAFLVLERLDTATARGSQVHAEIAGIGVGAEAYNRVAARPDGEGLARVILQVLAEAGIEPAEVGHVNAHGTGTPVNDATEAAALQTVFADASHRPWVASTKPVTGHTFGAAAALEAVLAIQSLRHRIAPFTVGLEEPDPRIGINLVTGRPEPLETRHVLSTSLGFWGNVAAILFRRSEPTGARLAHPPRQLGAGEESRFAAGTAVGLDKAPSDTQSRGHV